VVDDQGPRAERHQRGQHAVEHREPCDRQPHAVEDDQQSGDDPGGEPSGEPTGEVDGRRDRDDAQQRSADAPPGRGVADEGDARGDDPLPERRVDREGRLRPGREQVARVRDVVDLVEGDAVRDPESREGDDGGDDRDGERRHERGWGTASGHATERRLAGWRNGGTATAAVDRRRSVT
jgi:hypothetical protein